MPIEKPSEELAEQIRRNGMSDDKTIVAQWGYSAKEKPKVFLLENGEDLPKGWAAVPQSDSVMDEPEVPADSVEEAEAAPEASEPDSVEPAPVRRGRKKLS